MLWVLSVEWVRWASALRWVGWDVMKAVGGWLHVWATAEHPQPFSAAAVVGVLLF